MLGNDTNYECTECGFDTLPVVTVNYQTWEYCPVCGSELTEFNTDSVDQDDESEDVEEDEEMTTIPINGSQTNDAESDSSDTTGEPAGEPEETSDEQTKDESDSNTGDDVEKFVEDEMERLRSRYGSDEEEED